MINDPVQWARLAAQGDRVAFGELVSLYQTAIFNVAYRMLGEIAGAEDVTQETFIRAYHALSTYDSSRPILPWLKKIAVNLCLDQFKRPLNLPLNEELIAANPGLESQVSQQDRDYQIRASLLTLPPHYRAVIELRHFQEMSYDEIAQTLNRPISSIKTDLFRARKLLAERLKELR